jgi:hypothetical protein
MSSPAVDDILATVSAWPMEERLELINRLLESLRSSAETRRNERVLALQRLRGMLASEKPAPTDDEVAAWLDEHREQKYG